MPKDQPEIAVTTLARNATLDDFTALLREQDARNLDIVAPAWAIRARDGQMVIECAEPVLGPDGVTLAAGTYVPTEVCDLGLAGELGIPAAYLRRTRARPALYDSNVNSWLEGDQRKFLIRCLRPASGDGPGAARAFLSGNHEATDNLDVLLAALEGIRQAGVPVEIDGCDLTGRRMHVRIVCELVQALAPTLLRGYRSPFTGAAGADNPVIYAGFVLSNSETGCGEFTLTPRLVVDVCRNGMTITGDAIRSARPGGRPGEEAVTRSGNTPGKALELITASTADAVAAFLRPAYVDRVVRKISARADHPLTDPQEAVAVVSQRLRFTEAQQATIMAHFVKGGDATAGGIMHAVTSVARTLPDADAAHDPERQSLRVLEIATSL